MVDGATDTDLPVNQLRNRIRGLELALKRRSQELRTIQSRVCVNDLEMIARVCAGLDSEIDLSEGDWQDWDESTQLTSSAVRGEMGRIWKRAGERLDRFHPD